MNYALKFEELEEGQRYLVEDRTNFPMFDFTLCIVEDGIMKIESMSQDGIEFKSVLEFEASKNHFEECKSEFRFMKAD